MTNILLFMAAAGAMAPVATGPIRIDGAGLSNAELVTTGTASIGQLAVTIGGGRVTLAPAKQKALNTYLSGKPLTLLVSITDNGSEDTTAMVFGTLRLMEKDKGWYLVNNPVGEWHQVDLGKVVKGTPLKFALVAQEGSAHIWKEGKDVGNFTFKPDAEQVLTLGSPEGEANAFRGEIQTFDVTPKLLSAELMAKRLDPNAVTDTPATNPTTSPTSPADPPTTNTTETKSTTVQATLVDLSEVPDPQSILPYRHALIVQEYKISKVTNGNIKDVTAGSTIRVARWGIVAGKKTPIADQKKGEILTLTLEKMSDHPTLDHQYTVDTLPGNYTAPYLLDMSMTAPGG